MYSHYWLNFGITMKFSKVNILCNLVLIRVCCWDNLGRMIWKFLVASTKFFFAKRFSPVFASESTVLMPDVACSLFLSRWVLVSFLPCGEIMTPSGEDAFDFCDASLILFKVGAIFSPERVLVDFTLLRDGAVVERFMMLLVKITFFDCHPFLFSMMLLAVFERELEGRRSWLPMFLFPRSTIVASRASLITLICGLSLFQSHWRSLWCPRTIYGVVHGTQLPDLSFLASLSYPLDDA